MYHYIYYYLKREGRVYLLIFTNSYREIKSIALSLQQLLYYRSRGLGHYFYTKMKLTIIMMVCAVASSITIASAEDSTIDLLANALHGIAKTLKANNCCQPVGPEPLLTSCKEIKKKWPASISGYYKIINKAKSLVYVYCNMEELCGSGGWTRLAYLDMSDSTENCPSGFRLYQSGGVRACGRATSSGGSCTSVQFPSNGIRYSQVCGRVTGYQYGSPDALFNLHNYHHNNLNSYYLDGVSITHGSPRQHVWSLIAGIRESALHIGGAYNCPCLTGSKQTVQSFIGNDYYCESGTSSSWAPTFYTSDPLWDGKGCHSLKSPCCAAPNLPWFHKDYGNTTTTDYIELRVCGDQETIDEDVPISYYELYVK